MNAYPARKCPMYYSCNHSGHRIGDERRRTAGRAARAVRYVEARRLVFVVR